MEGDLPLLGLDDVALDAFLEHLDAQFADPLSSDPSDVCTTEITHPPLPSSSSPSSPLSLSLSLPSSTNRKRPRSGSTSNSEDSAPSGPAFSPVFPPEFSDECLARNIAAATERDLKAMNIDPNSKEGKKQKRLIRNRMSAQLHRERKREHLKQLEQQLAAKEELIQALQARVQMLEHENAQLRANAGQSTVSAARRVPAAAGVTLFSVFAMVCCVMVWMDPSNRWASISLGSGPLVAFRAPPSQAVMVHPRGRVLLTSEQPSNQPALLPYDETRYTDKAVATRMQDSSYPIQHHHHHHHQQQQQSQKQQSPTAVVRTRNDWRQYYGAAAVASSSSHIAVADSHSRSKGMTVVVSPNTYRKHRCLHCDNGVECDPANPACDDHVKPLWQYSTSLDIYPKWKMPLDAPATRPPADDTNNATNSTSRWGGKSRLRGAKAQSSSRDVPKQSNNNSHPAQTSVHIIEPVHSLYGTSEPSFVACTSATTSLSPAILPSTAGRRVSTIPDSMSRPAAQSPSVPVSSSTSTPSSTSTSTSTSASTSTSPSFALVPSISRTPNLVSMAAQTSSANSAAFDDSSSDPTLLMVLPASSIRWRSDGSHMMFDMKSPNKDATNGALHDIIENFTVDEQPPDLTKADIWVEIRCKVMQARLLNNVEINHLQ